MWWEEELLIELAQQLDEDGEELELGEDDESEEDDELGADEYDDDDDREVEI